MKTFYALAVILSSFNSVFGVPIADAASQDLEKVLFPNYLVPIKQAKPKIAFPTQKTGQVHYENPTDKNEIKLLVGFDVPKNVGTRCAIKFGLEAKVPGGYQWTVNGSGMLDVWSLASMITPGVTTWNNKPKRTTTDPQFTITQYDDPEGGDAIMTGKVIPCKGGQRMDFEVAGTRSGGPVYFDWYELDSPKSGITLNMYT
ncbi:ubiquitin 3 binding protein But2 C-terminal domain-containing protein [Trichophaea hybrida]|nr:ubiquitin 3 binding protein But2 C-terminal domain-containing protein [Trichophaea hybrida]